MRGRTNTDLYYSFGINATKDQYVVDNNCTIVAGDFVEYNNNTNKVRPWQGIEQTLGVASENGIAGSQINIYVPKYPTRILIDSSEVKKKYKLNETLDLSGIKVYAIMQDNSIIEITNECTFNPANGTTVTADVTNVIASWTWNPALLSFTDNMDLEFDIPSWANATYDEIDLLLNQHYSGNINLWDYWNVGDERIVTLSSMPTYSGYISGRQIYIDETHEQQQVKIVLLHKGGYRWSSTQGYKTCAFIIGQKDCLLETGKQDSTSSYHKWSDVARKKWCDEIYYQSIPSGLRNLLKYFEYKAYGSSNINYVTLPSEMNIKGTEQISRMVEQDIQLDYYKDTNNIIKHQGNNGIAIDYWTRSSGYTQFDTSIDRMIAIDSNGDEVLKVENANCGIVTIMAI